MNKTFQRILIGTATATLLVVSLGGCDITILLFGDALDNNTADISIGLEWDNANVDLDLYVTAPDVSAPFNVDIPVYADIDEAYTIPGGSPAYQGFYPEHGTGDRVSVYDAAPTGAGGTIEHVYPDEYRDTVELINVSGLPVSTDNITAYNTEPLEANALPSGLTYAFMGIMEVYVYSPSGRVDNAGDVEVTVFNSNDDVIARVPLNESGLSIDGMSVLRIPFFETDDGQRYYQLLLDKRHINDDTVDIRSLASADQNFLVLGTFGR